MRVTILFALLACLAFSLVSAAKESSHQPRNHPRKHVAQTKRVKRQEGTRVVVFNDQNGQPFYMYL